MDRVTPAWVNGSERYDPRAKTDVAHVVVHRISVHVEDVSYADSPADIARFFREHPTGVNASGGKMPYSLLIDGAGAVTQAVPLGRVTPHARVHNRTAVGIACIGDFRTEKPSPEQKRALVHVCVGVLASCGLDATALVGHDELPGGSRDPNKECPGRYLNIASLRDVVAAALVRRHEGNMHLVW